MTPSEEPAALDSIGDATAHRGAIIVTGKAVSLYGGVVIFDVRGGDDLLFHGDTIVVA